MAPLRAARVVWKSATDTTIKAPAAWRISSRFYSWPRFALARPTEIATVVLEVIYGTNVLGEEKARRPVKCYANLFV
jgi:hypothetical protein